MNSDNGKVYTEINNGVANLIFFHPKGNSLPSVILKGLAEEINSLSENNEVKVIILKSEGDKAFCAGASFDELVAIDNFENGKKFFMGFAHVINAIRKSPKIVIARIQNKAIGGGVGLAAAADYTFAVDFADIRLSEFALGIGPFVVGPAVERKIGKAAFSQMSIDADYRTALWAKDKGLYVDIFSTVEELDSSVNNFANKLSQMSLEAMLDLKKIFWEGCENWDELLESRAEISGRLVLSDFTKNYINQFKKK